MQFLVKTIQFAVQSLKSQVVKGKLKPVHGSENTKNNK